MDFRLLNGITYIISVQYMYIHHHDNTKIWLTLETFAYRRHYSRVGAWCRRRTCGSDLQPQPRAFRDKTLIKIKADRPLMHDTLNAPWQTDNSNELVMVIRNYHWLNSASRVLISTCSAPMVQMGERKQCSLFDLDLWPTILTYNTRLAKVKVDRYAKNQGQRSNSSNRRAPTDKWTDPHTDATKRIISPLDNYINFTQHFNICYKLNKWKCSKCQTWHDRSPTMTNVQHCSHDKK